MTKTHGGNPAFTSLMRRGFNKVYFISITLKNKKYVYALALEMSFVFSFPIDPKTAKVQDSLSLYSTWDIKIWVPSRDIHTECSKQFK